MKQKPSKVRVTRERLFKPHLLLFTTAERALEESKKKAADNGPWYYDALIARTFAALSLEAKANAFGHLRDQQWASVERNLSVKDKFKHIASLMNFSINFAVAPWPAISDLIKFRNEVAHAKVFLITVDKVVSSTHFEKTRYDIPESDLEKAITIKKAEIGVRAVEEVYKFFLSKLTEEEQRELSFDSWSGGAEPAME